MTVIDWELFSSMQEHTVINTSKKALANYNSISDHQGDFCKKIMGKVVKL